jgi:hypothetical protein
MTEKQPEPAAVAHALEDILAHLGERGDLAMAAAKLIVQHADGDDAKRSMLTRFYAMMWNGFLAELVGEFESWKQRNGG